jgi:hypothetical protein
MPNIKTDTCKAVFTSFPMEIWCKKFNIRRGPNSSPQNGSLMCKNDLKQAGF